MLPPFQSVLDELGPRLWRYCVGAVGADRAADVYQETVLAALRRYPDLTDASRLDAWFFTVAHSRVVDAHRARGRAPLTVAEPPDRGIVDETVDHELWAAVGELPPRQRACVVLRYLADLTHADVAATVGISEAASRQNVRVGLARLRDRLAAPAPPPSVSSQGAPS